MVIIVLIYFPNKFDCIGRTIKKMTAWSGMWPPIREFMQNTIDHLKLVDHVTGRRHAALKLTVSNDSENTLSYSFHCGDVFICAIRVVSANEIEIEQAYTFPLPPRALDTGVPDTTKLGGSTAGGFGDGFKTAAVALLSLGKSNFQELSWTFIEGGRRIIWDFTGCHRSAVGSFAACEVLEVHIQNVPDIQNTGKTN